MYSSRRHHVMSGVLSSIMAYCLPFAVWICRNNRCDDVDGNQCTSRINISRNMHLVDEQHPTPNNTEEIITKRHFSYVQELPHPSKLRKVKATAKVSKKRQRDLAVEQHVQQLRHKQLVFPSSSPVHSSATVEKAADLEVSTSDQRLAVRLPSHFDLPAAETAATSLEMTPAGDSQETLPDAGGRTCSKSDEEDDEWLKERWKALPYVGKQHEE
ncbi:uncharacterized protein LOC112553531 isoform X2 [Pomacea canaliculata]|uniref:uncharacterized protein LOC112553531 isoform X2 n=1 Tax=Pomacea canaliculata TaxID=400727 RepID=UPI000D72D6D3|nr:uncharacterized protein LOC112553531 isoform X2 [Pomacea canaliculata]